MKKYNVFDFENFDIPALVKQCDSLDEAVKWVNSQKYPKDYEIEEDRTASVQDDKYEYCGICDNYVRYCCEDTDHCSYYEHPDYDVFG